MFNCLEDITHPFLFTCYVNSALCYFVLADQFIKFPDVPLFFVKSKDFLYEFWWSFFTRWNSSGVIDSKISHSILSLSHITWLIYTRSCNNLPMCCKIKLLVWTWFYFLVVGLSVESCCDDNEEKIASDKSYDKSLIILFRLVYVSLLEWLCHNTF